jgi:hypothetical protein
MRTSVPELPVEFEQVVSKALAKDRGQRYQTIAEFASALQELKDEIKLGALVLPNDGSLNALTVKTRTATDPQAKQKTERVSLSKDGANDRWVDGGSRVVTVFRSGVARNQ